jgi:hypothetical protein
MTTPLNGQARVNALNLVEEVQTKLVAMTKYLLLQQGLDNGSTTSDKRKIEPWIIFQAMLNVTIFDYSYIVCCLDLKFRISEFL